MQRHLSSLQLSSQMETLIINDNLQNTCLTHFFRPISDQRCFRFLHSRQFISACFFWHFFHVYVSFVFTKCFVTRNETNLTTGICLVLKGPYAIKNQKRNGILIFYQRTHNFYLIFSNVFRCHRRRRCGED